MQKKHKNDDEPMTLDPGFHRRLRANVLQDHNGAPEKQKDDLVNDILNAFQNPEHWPCVDAERVYFLKKWYRMAQKIRETEAAMIAAAKK